MPATYTHHLFTKDVYKSLNVSIQDKLDIDIFNLFGKGFDVFYFYKPKLSNLGHTTNINLYFSNIVSYLRSNHETHNSELLAYLYGSICHYVLDSTVHPFIYYYGGKYIKSKKSSHKYRGCHSYIELMIDAVMCQERNNKKLQQYNLTRDIFPKLSFTRNLEAAINKVYLDTFNIDNGWKHYFRGYKCYRFCFKHIMMSRFGIKKNIYKVIDKIHIFPKIKLQNYCYFVSKPDYSVLNLEHKKWYYPVDRKINYHYSFFDLYDVAVIKAVKFITLIDEVLDKDEKALKKALKELGNASYLTGVNEKRKVTMKYFAN